MPVLEILIPVFLIVLLGAVLARVGFLAAGILGELNRLVYWVGLPAFLFGSVANAKFGDGALMISGTIIGSTIVVGALAYAVTAMRKLPWESSGTFVQAATRGNLAYVGLPVIALAAEHTAVEPGSLNTLALLSMAPAIVTFNIVGICALAASRQGLGRGTLKTALVELITNPLLIALGAGVAVSWSGVALPGWFRHSVATTGQMALPLALICIGGALVTTQIVGRRVSSMLASLLKIAAAPAIGFALGRLAGLDANEMRIALIFLACPTAAASFVLVGKLGGDEPLAAGTVVLSTVLCVVPLAVILVLV